MLLFEGNNVECDHLQHFALYHFQNYIEEIFVDNLLLKSSS